MPAEDMWVKLVAKLNAMTQDGKLTWEGPTMTKLENGRIQRDYFAKYKDKYFRVRKSTGGTVERPGAIGIVTRTLATSHYLAIVDEEKNFLFGIPDVPGIEDLYESVVYLRAGIKEIIDDLLKDK